MNHMIDGWKSTDWKPPLRVIVECLAGSGNPTMEAINAALPMASKILDELTFLGHLPLPNCGDCNVAPGELHIPGCDVALCKVCGDQAISCDRHDGPPTTWTGRFPGKVEVEEYGLADLNDLGRLIRSGSMQWDSDRERWFKR